MFYALSTTLDDFLIGHRSRSNDAMNGWHWAPVQTQLVHAVLIANQSIGEVGSMGIFPSP